MTKDIEHFLKYFSINQDFSVENSLFSSVPHFKIESFSVLVSNLSSFKILHISPLSDVVLVKILYQSVGYYFVHNSQKLKQHKCGPRSPQLKSVLGDKV